MHGVHRGNPRVPVFPIQVCSPGDAGKMRRYERLCLHSYQSQTDARGAGGPACAAPQLDQQRPVRRAYHAHQGPPSNFFEEIADIDGITAKIISADIEISADRRPAYKKYAKV